jgi:glycosyltransferase involved in cell wall biosynthesis
VIVTKLKVLMINYEFPPVGGGASPVTFELCKQLVKLGHDVDVVTMRYGNLPRFEEFEGIRVFRTPALRRRPDICRTHEMATYYFGAVCKALSFARREKYDIIHCHFIVPGGPLAWTISRFASIPFLVTCHGSDVPGYNPDRFSLVHTLIHPVWRFLVKRSSLLVSPSESLKELILKNYPQANVVVVPNGIYTDCFTARSKTRSILMCSRLFRRKGFQYVIRAISQMQLDWQVNIIGDGPYLADLKALASEVGTPIKFWGWLDRDDKMFRQLFEESSIFVFPSEVENFPTVLLEAMSAGMAVITSNAGGCPEVVGQAGILVEPGDVEGIKRNLCELIDNEQRRRELSQAALKRAQQFSWQTVTGRYIDLYREVIDRGKCSMKSK